MVQHMNNPAMRQMWVLDAQWTDCPLEIEEIVKALWRHYELGNDRYMLRNSMETFLEMEEDGFQREVFKWGETPEQQLGWVKEPMSLMPLVDYVRSKGIPDNEEIIIHWWW